MQERESMEFDIVVIGAGPAGLSMAIRYAQICNDNGCPPSICVLEKGQEVGSHILSGAVINPIALDELLPNHKDLYGEAYTPVTSDHFCFLTQQKSFKLPTPKTMHNKGHFISSLGNLCGFLATQAEELGVDIFPGFAATRMITDKNDEVIGVATGDMGIGKKGEHKDNFNPGIDIYCKQLILSEGVRGSLSQIAIEKYKLRIGQEQSYGIGLKEIWRVDSSQHDVGKIVHTIGWPLNTNTYGGSFIYHLKDKLVALGFVIGLDYANPNLNPFMEFQRFKHHPMLEPLLNKGQCISYGAKALNEGGFQSLPKLSFPGGLIIGCSAGFLNVPQIKGTHYAMKSGMLAAESVFKALQKNEEPQFEKVIRNSWIYKELKQVRNIRPGFKWGLWPGLANAALETYLFKGKMPWTIKHRIDHKQLNSKYKTIDYPKPDGKISFDRLSQLSKSGVYHDDDQPCHLVIKNKRIPIEVNLEQFNGPEQRYCPAGVYEFINNELVINAQNCLHCKTCDIKDYSQNIQWTPPEGGGGPNYSGM